MPNPIVDVDDFIDQLRREFIETTSERLNSVDDLITEMMEGNDPDAALAEFLRHIHSIKGQGATFDFPSVTTVAHRLEDYIETAAEHTAAQLKDIQYFVDVIRRIIESGQDPDEKEQLAILVALPQSAKDFAEVEAFDEHKPIQDVKIVLVMPKGTQRKIIGKELAACGFQISNADTPIDALKHAINHKPDIVIASREMDQMGGQELARVFSSVEATKNVHVVIATTSAKTEQEVSGLPATTRVIQKGPGFIDDLTDCLGGWGFFG